MTAVFDGTCLKPTGPLDLEPNRPYRLTIEDMTEGAGEGDAWEELSSLVGTVEAPSDWAAEHDHYLYGTAKRQP